MQLGVIIRDEIVVKGDNYKNGMVQIVSEKERVAKNEAVFRYLADDEENLKNKIEEIDLKIQEALSKQEIFSSTDIKNLEKQIDNKVKNIRKITDLQKIGEYKKDITNILNKKARIIGESSSSGSYIKELTDEKEQIESELKEGSEYVTAPIAGMVSYRVDGLENTLKPENFEEYTIEKLEGLNLKTGKIIPIGNEEAKVINNFVIYVATVLNSEIARNSKIGDKVTFTLANGEEIDAKIEHIIKKDEEKDVLIVFKLANVKDEFIEYRKISYNITWWSKSGLKVPNDAILEDENQNKYIVKERAGNYSKIFVNVLKQNDKYSIVENYTAEDYEKNKIDASKYGKVTEHDMILMYPNASKLKTN